MKTVKEWLNEINIRKLIGYYRTMYPTCLDDTRLDETMTIRQCRDMEQSNLLDAIHQLQNMPIKLPDDGTQYIIFSYRTLLDGSDDEAYAIVSVNQLLDYCTEADTLDYDQYEPSVILGFLVADTRFVQTHIYGLLCDILLNTINPHLHPVPLPKPSPFSIPVVDDSYLLAVSVPSAQEVENIVRVCNKLHFDTEANRVKNIAKAATRQYADHQRTKALYKIYRLMKC